VVAVSLVQPSVFEDQAVLIRVQLGISTDKIIDGVIPKSHVPAPLLEKLAASR
jgi:hypothetical protein